MDKELVAGVYCKECGKQATEAEYSNGECSECGGEIGDESEYIIG